MSDGSQVEGRRGPRPPSEPKPEPYPSSLTTGETILVNSKEELLNAFQFINEFVSDDSHLDEYEPISLPKRCYCFIDSTHGKLHHGGIPIPDISYLFDQPKLSNNHSLIFMIPHGSSGWFTGPLIDLEGADYLDKRARNAKLKTMCMAHALKDMDKSAEDILFDKDGCPTKNAKLLSVQLSDISRGRFTEVGNSTPIEEISLADTYSTTDVEHVLTDTYFKYYGPEQEYNEQYFYVQPSKTARQTTVNLVLEVYCLYGDILYILILIRK